MELFVTSDTHFGHENIITYCSRPFANAEEMDEEIIRRWNETVRPQDHVYHLGDVAMKKPHLERMRRCHGHHRLVRGNHDIFPTKEYLKYFDEIYGIRVLDRTLLTHIPVHPDSLGRFKGNVHGHVHQSTALALPYLNVCVEVTDYRPVAWAEVQRRLG